MDMINSDPSCLTGVHKLGLAEQVCGALQKYEQGYGVCLPVHRDVLLTLPRRCRHCQNGDSYTYSHHSYMYLPRLYV